MPTRGGGDARNRLLTTARRRFAADGALSPTLDEVRREAEVSVGALYHHFPDKRALAAAVFAQLIREYQDGFLEALVKQPTAEGGIRAGVVHHLRWVVAHRAEAALLLGDRLDSAELQDANRRFFSAVGDWWRPHHAYGVLGPMQPGITSALWLGPAQEYSRYWLAGTAAKISSRTVETFAAAAWAALRQHAEE
ncbi:TetR/AcrR family transcriptional regulator [Mycolicibacterium arseniciresistens]|uniref:TetR/AcrR family transcriptional regulator n=1 Tax=Mycolicibacterium arseniciresistens TaxID=3062257 RepID=A0ABT8UEW0_9MYCO|nr:TetR/AcrR family transcriptional regulator [Mycolicibacterium arseniciresistens]MDO3635711.1 TetR/AcrR family transcriptional regulator [Mycolicibacterium arseniciresistens]